MILDITLCRSCKAVRFLIDSIFSILAWSMMASHQQSPNPGVSVEVCKLELIDVSFWLILFIRGVGFVFFGIGNVGLVGLVGLVDLGLLGFVVLDVLRWFICVDLVGKVGFLGFVAG